MNTMILDTAKTAAPQGVVKDATDQSFPVDVLEASRQVPVLGVAFIGDENADNVRTICDLGNVQNLGRLPRLDPLNGVTLRAAFAANFRLEDFA